MCETDENVLHIYKRVFALTRTDNTPFAICLIARVVFDSNEKKRYR